MREAVTWSRGLVALALALLTSCAAVRQDAAAPPKGSAPDASVADGEPGEEPASRAVLSVLRATRVSLETDTDDGTGAELQANLDTGDGFGLLYQPRGLDGAGAVRLMVTEHDTQAGDDARVTHLGGSMSSAVSYGEELVLSPMWGLGLGLLHVDLGDSSLDDELGATASAHVGFTLEMGPRVVLRVLTEAYVWGLPGETFGDGSRTFVAFGVRF